MSRMCIKDNETHLRTRFRPEHPPVRYISANVHGNAYHDANVHGNAYHEFTYECERLWKHV